MGRLTENTTEDKTPIGREGLLKFIDELNAKRREHGFTDGYVPVTTDGKMTMKEVWHSPEPNQAREGRDRWVPAPGEFDVIRRKTAEMLKAERG